MPSDPQESKKPIPDPQSNDTDSSSTTTSTSTAPLHPQLQIVDQLSEEKLHQYESFRRSGISKTSIKKLCSNIIAQACNPNFIIAVSGVAKVFVGEMVKEAKDVQRGWEQEGPLMPSHVHEAYRRLYGEMPNMKVYRKFFE